MQFEKKQSLGNFAEKGNDIKDGDIISFLNEGEVVHGDYQGKPTTQNIFVIKCVDGQEKNLGVNQTSINNVVDSYGKESKEWVGKPLRVWLNRENVSGTFRLVVYLTHPDLDLECNKTNDQSDVGEVSIENG